MIFFRPISISTLVGVLLLVVAGALLAHGHGIGGICAAVVGMLLVSVVFERRSGLEIPDFVRGDDDPLAVRRFLSSFAPRQRFRSDAEVSIPFDPDWVVAPGETLKDWFEETLTLWSTAERFGIDEWILKRLFSGEEPITEDLALRLSDLTGVRKEMWLALEHNYRTGLAAGKKRSGV